MSSSSSFESRLHVIATALFVTAMLTGCLPDQSTTPMSPPGAAHEIVPFVQMPPEDPWYGPTAFSPGAIIVGSAPEYLTDITAQDAAATSWASSFSLDTYQSYDQYTACAPSYGYYGARINYSCPQGPCYTQWYQMKDAQLNFSGKVNSFLLAGPAVRHAWGLFVAGLPATTIIASAWNTLDGGHKRFLSCINEPGNWKFYNNDQPNPYRISGLPR